MEPGFSLFKELLQALLQRKVFVIVKEVKDQNNISGVIYLPKRLIGKVALIITEEVLNSENEDKGTDSSG